MSIEIINKIFDLLSIAGVLSIILMALIQKIKSLNCINKDCHIWYINIFLSFSLGIYFSMYFFKVSFSDAIWISIFSFIGAPSLYDLLKNQELVNFKPKSLDDIQLKRK